MDHLKIIIERLRENEAIAEKFNEIETKILSILNFKDLFEVLLTEIRRNFSVPCVWMSMIGDSEVSSLILSSSSSEVLKGYVNIINRNIFMELIGYSSKPLLVNDNLKPYFKLLPENRKYFIKSLAIAPITLDGDIIGSLNQADFTHTRFQPGFDTSLLKRLALKVSICLSNVTAHEKLKYLALHDPLTGLLNRKVMISNLKREFKRAKRYSNVLSLAMFNVENFESINNTYGYDFGDNLLKFVADVLNKITRDSDIAAKFAENEFIIILPETTKKDAACIMNRLADHFIHNHLKSHGVSVPILIRFGLESTEDESVNDPELLLKKAGEMLEVAEKGKHNP